MDVIERIARRPVFIDTAPFIYFIERHPRCHPIIRPAFESLSEGSFAGTTSAITLLEVLVQPLRQGRADLARECRSILTESSGIRLMPVTTEAAEMAADLRERHSIRVADAIQAAAGIRQNCAVFITNDARLKCLTEFADVIVLADLVPPQA